MKSVKYLLDLQQQEGLNDTALSKKLGITQAAISQYKSGKRVMDDETCLAVALALEVNPMQIIGAACIDRAEKTGQKSLWEVFMSRSAAVAASVLVASSVNLFLTPKDAEARTYSPSAAQGEKSIYIMSNRRRRKNRPRLRAMAAWIERLFMAGALVPTAR